MVMGVLFSCPLLSPGDTQAGSPAFSSPVTTQSGRHSRDQEATSQRHGTPRSVAAWGWRRGCKPPHGHTIAGTEEPCHRLTKNHKGTPDKPTRPQQRQKSRRQPCFGCFLRESLVRMGRPMTARPRGLRDLGLEPARWVDHRAAGTPCVGEGLGSTGMSEGGRDVGNRRVPAHLPAPPAEAGK